MVRWQASCSPPACFRYPATVEVYNARTGQHTLGYEDSWKETEDLSKSPWKMEVHPEPLPKLGPSFLTFTNEEDVSDSEEDDDEDEEDEAEQR